MHPIERLRFVARAAGEDPGLLAREAAGALASFADEPQHLVVACRRLVERAPAAGPIWWLAAHVLGGNDPRRDAWRAAEEIEADATPHHLAAAIPADSTVTVIGWPDQVGMALRRRGDLEVLAVESGGGGSGLVRHLTGADVEAVAIPDAGAAAAVLESDLVVIEAAAAGPESVLAALGSRAAAAVARHAGIDVWVVAGVGRALPGRLWDAMCRRLEGEEPWDAPAEPVSLDLVSTVVGPDGVGLPEDLAARADCPIPPELVRD